MKMKRVVFSIVVAALVMVLVWGVLRTRNAEDRQRPEGDLRKISVAQWGQERYLIYLPLYVALERGLFAERGLDVALKFTGNDDQTFAAVAQGGASFGIGDPVFAAIANQKGLEARVVAEIVGGVAIWGVAKQGSTGVIEKPEDLAGLRIGTFPSPSTNYTLMSDLLAALPVGIAQPKIVQAGIGSQIALLESGAADVAMVLEPAASIAEFEGYRVVYSSPRFHGPFAFTGVTATKSFLDREPDLARRFVAALEEAVVLCHKNPAAAVDVAAGLFPTVDREVIANAVNRMISEGTLPTTVQVDPAGWTKAIDTRLRVGDLESTDGTSEVVDNRFHPAAKR